MASYDVTAIATSKILIHAAKFPSVAVNGILLGRKTAKGESDAGPVSILDAVPLFHTNLNLTPMLDVALEQVDSYASDSNLRVVGYYQANQNPDDRNPSLVGKTITSLIESKTGSGALYLVVDAAKMAFDMPLLGYVKDGNSWQLVKGKFTVEMPAKSVIAHSSFELLHDFDEHLESLDNDWLKNSKVAKLIDTR